MKLHSVGMVVGCCLMAAAPGCSFHRTERGFIARGGCWTLERNRHERETPVETASAEPESLPWRTRLKGYRLGARILHGRDHAVVESELPEEVAETDGESRRPIHSALKCSLESEEEDAALPPAPRPDLVVD